MAGAFAKSAQPIKKLCLLAAVALQQIHWVNGYCVTTDVVVAVEFHDASCEIWCREPGFPVSLPHLCGGVPLYTGNDTRVIPLHLVFFIVLGGNLHHAVSFP
jgi:hypothetical protein